MNDAEFAKQKRRIQVIFKKWQPILRLTGWEFTWQYHRQCLPDAGPNAPRWEPLGRCTPMWEYKSALVEFVLSSVADLTDDELEGHIVHELVHVLVNELKEYDMERPETVKHEERVVTEVTWAFLALARRKEKK